MDAVDRPGFASVIAQRPARCRRRQCCFRNIRKAAETLAAQGFRVAACWIGTVDATGSAGCVDESLHRELRDAIEMLHLNSWDAIRRACTGRFERPQSGNACIRRFHVFRYVVHNAPIPRRK